MISHRQVCWGGGLPRASRVPGKATHLHGSAGVRNGMVWNAPCGTSGHPAPQHPPPAFPSTWTNLSALCKSSLVSPASKGGPSEVCSISPRPCAGSQTRLGQVGGGCLAAGRCCCSRVEMRDAEPQSVQMGGSGDRAWGAVSRINADGVSLMQFRRQMILMKRHVNPPRTPRTGGFWYVLMPPIPCCCLSAPSVMVSSGTQSLPSPVTSAQPRCPSSQPGLRIPGSP